MRASHDVAIPQPTSPELRQRNAAHGRTPTLAIGPPAPCKVGTMRTPIRLPVRRSTLVRAAEALVLAHAARAKALHRIAHALRFAEPDLGAIADALDHVAAGDSEVAGLLHAMLAREERR